MTTPLGEGWAAFHQVMAAARIIRSPWRTMIVRGARLRIIGHPYFSIRLAAADWSNDNEKRE